MILDVEDRLVEQAVITALYRKPEPGFHHEREAVYRLVEAEARENAFRDFYGRWFQHLKLDSLFRQVLAEHPQVETALERCRVSAAGGGAEEGSQLFVQATGVRAPQRRWAIRIRAITLVDAMAALRLLRREILYVSDMVDPTFGYEPKLPPSAGGALEDRLAVDRYGAAWAATVVGRLLRSNHLQSSARAEALAPFKRAFVMLGDEAEALFERLFLNRPTHRELAQLALEPELSVVSAVRASGSTCSLCGMPAYQLLMVDDPVVQRAIRAEFTEWTTMQGVCSRCVEIYTTPAAPPVMVNQENVPVEPT